MRIEPDRYLSKITRKIGLLPGGKRSVEFLRRYFSKKYRGKGNAMVVIEDYDGNLRLKFDRSTHMGSLIYWNGYASPAELALLDKILKPGMVFADIGANLGEFTVYAGKRVKTGKVLAFEPFEPVFKLLLENIELNHLENVIAFQVGLWNQNGELPFYLGSERDDRSFVYEGWSTAVGGKGSQQISKVKMVVFDDWFEGLQISRLDLMKIDTEGAELQMLTGARKSLEKYSPDLIVEICEQGFNRSGYTSQSLLEFLGSLNYEPFLIKRYGVLIPVSYAEVPKQCNVFCRRKSR